MNPIPETEGPLAGLVETMIGLYVSNTTSDMQELQRETVVNHMKGMLLGARTRQLAAFLLTVDIGGIRHFINDADREQFDRIIAQALQSWNAEYAANPTTSRLLNAITRCNNEQS